MSRTILSSITEADFEPGKNLGKRHSFVLAEALNQQRANTHLMKTEQSAHLRASFLSCSPNARCHKASCTLCNTAVRYNMRRPLFLHALSDFENTYAISIVDDRDKVAPNELQNFDLRKFSRRTKDRLHDAGLEYAVLGVDFSYNEHESGRYAPYWQPHSFGYGATYNPAAINDQFEASDTTPRPVKVQSWDGRVNLFDYMIKPDFRRRVGLDDVCVIDSGTGASRYYRDVSYQRLRAAEQHELLQYLFRNTIDNRYIFIGCQLRTQGGKLKIVNTKRP